MKTINRLCLQVGLAMLVVVYVESVAIDGYSDSSAVDAEDDGEAQATEFHPADAVQAHSKYFQYAHVPHKDHYEHGHKRGNEHHFIERHEKAHPHSGEFKTKVRWGDKHGGYGEHYWDYNHAGHGDSHDEGSEQIEDVEEPSSRPKRHHVADEYSYAYDPETGHIIDQNTGRSFILQPID